MVDIIFNHNIIKLRVSITLEYFSAEDFISGLKNTYLVLGTKGKDDMSMQETKFLKFSQIEVVEYYTEIMILSDVR